MADFVIETTNESDVVEQKRVSANQTVLNLSRCGLVRVVGLEQATTLKTLYVRRRINRIWCRISRILVLSVQLHNNCFVDVPACVLAMTQLSDLSVSLVLFLFVSSLSFADSSAARMEPLVVSARCPWSLDGADRALGAN
jgi:hypothetical protein